MESAAIVSSFPFPLLSRTEGRHSCGVGIALKKIEMYGFYVQIKD
jgi:hypothetical protein